MRRSTLLLVAACLLAACSVEPPRADTPSEAPSSAVPAPAPDGPDVAPPDVPGAIACAQEDVAAMDAQVAGQLDAIADRDWSAALGFATDEFRAVHDDGRFERIITDGFPVVASNASHASDACVRSDDTAQLLVTVTATDGATTELVYLMDLEDGTWRIGGAVPHGAGADDPDTQVV